MYIRIFRNILPLLMVFCSCSSGGYNTARLSGLLVSSGVLSPDFDGDTLSYTLKLPITTSSVIFIATAEHAPLAKIRINDLPVSSGEESYPVIITPGANSISIVVTAADNNTTTTYTINTLQTIDEFAQLITGSDTGNSDWFGASVACDGTTLVVGAPRNRVVPLEQRGAVYVFTKVNNEWVQEAKLTASDGANNDRFGWSVTLSGNTIAVGAPYRNEGAETRSGAVYIFIKSGATWSQQGNPIKAPDPCTDHYFGFGVALYGNTLAVGEPNSDNLACTSAGAGYVGSVKIYTRSGTTWTYRTTIYASDMAGNSYFGEIVVLEAGTLAISAKGRSSNRGAVYIFNGADASWSQMKIVTPSTTASGNNFGSAISLSGTRLLVGAKNEDYDGLINSGAVYLFSGSGSSWSEAGKIGSSNPVTNQRFGTSVAIYENVIAIGAPGPTGSVIPEELPPYQDGIIEVYVKNLFVWEKVSDQISPEESQISFGRSIAVTDTEIIVGADNYDQDASGAIYVYE